MRKVLISETVEDKLADLRVYLIAELNLSEEAAFNHSRRMRAFVYSLALPADYSLCRFKRWRDQGYRCAVFEKSWVFAYEIFDDGVIVREMSHTKLLNV